MPEDVQAWLATAAWVFPLAGVVLWRLGRGGHLAAGALDHAPAREVGVGPLELVAGLLLMVVGVFAGQQVLIGLGITADESGSWATSRGGAVAMLVMQLFSMGPAAGLFAVKAGFAEAGLRRSGLVPRRPGRDAAWGGLALLAAAPLVMAATLVVSGIALLAGVETPAIAHAALTRMRAEASPVTLAILIASAVVVAPLLEEVVFRGLLQTALLKVAGGERRWVVIAFASGLFAVTHMGAAVWQSLAALFALSVILGYLYEKTGSLWPSILCHAGFNAYNVAVAVWVVPAEAG